MDANYNNLVEQAPVPAVMDQSPAPTMSGFGGATADAPPTVAPVSDVPAVVNEPTTATPGAPSAAE